MVGAGAVGARAARQLLSLGDIDDLVVIDPDEERLSAVVASLGRPARTEMALASALAGDPPAVVVLANPAGPHAPLALTAINHGASVVSASDDIGDVRRLLDLDQSARECGVHVVVGAGFSPGLSCALAAYAARPFERVEEIHIAKVGTGGAACVNHLRQARRGPAQEWADNSWNTHAGWSGRRLCWFPDPIGGLDCYRGSLPEPLLLADVFEGVRRVSARVAARRRDRVTAHLPVLRTPKGVGPLGAVRVEVQGWQGTTLGERVVGAIDHPSVAAGTVSALAAHWAVDGRLSRTGAGGLASMAEPGPFLSALAEWGIKVAIFEGVGSRVPATVEV